MNIFYLDKCPQAAAAKQCDQHVVKMILESAQMLSTAHHEYGGDAPYKPTHQNHPCTRWAQANQKHYRWLYAHMQALAAEYTKRFGKTHLTWSKCREALRRPPAAMPETIWADPPQCMPEKFQRASTVAAYRAYYKYKASVFDMRWRQTRKRQ